MLNQNDIIISKLNQILVCLIEGDLDFAIELFGKVESELINGEPFNEFIVNFGKFIKHYHDSSVFLKELANGNLNITPPKDPYHQNFMISQFKQLHSNLRHLTWQTQQIAKGDLTQKVSFLGEFSDAYNQMIDSLREKNLLEERNKIQFEQLEKLNAEKDKFFSIIAHDLRSPFTSFLGLTQIMAEELEELSMEEIKKFALSMKKSATNLFSLLENLLEWANIQRGLIPYSPELICLLPVVSENTEMLILSANNKQIDIQIDIPEDLKVLADYNSIETVFRNLISNAIKFTPKGGNINISAKLIPVNLVEISIKDSGVGIKPSMLENLFKLDINTSHNGTEGELGSGLGLILCKEFVEKHGGKIWVESEEGKGSCFYFTLENNRIIN